MREENALLEVENDQQEIPAEAAEAVSIAREDTVEEIVVEDQSAAQETGEEMSVAEFLAAEIAAAETESSENAAEEENLPSVETETEEASDEEKSSEEAASEEASDAEATEEEEEEEEEEETPATIPVVLPYHERYYLRYREGKRSMPLDLSGTKAFLQEIGFDGGELRQARAGRKAADTFRQDNLNLGSQVRCSYCGAEIGGVEFFRLPDGRRRCTACSNSVVKSKAEVETLCQRVISNMDNFFGASFNVPISIEIMDELKLKKKIGLPLGIRDLQSLLILGAAINKKDKYSIILENGAPRISLIATFAHELTHIWQYTHWDNLKGFKQCPPSKRMLIYEGMAKWAEIQYLYLIGETAVAKREEFITRNREDPYGVGFCLYEERYPLSREAMNCPETPFTPGRYPFE